MRPKKIRNFTNSTMKNFFKLFLYSLLFVVFSCGQDNSKEEDNSILETEIQHSAAQETQQMVDELKRLVDYGDPKNYYNWNHARAEIRKQELAEVDYSTPIKRYIVIALNFY